MRTIKKSSTGILRRAAAVLAIAAVTVMMMPFMTNVTGSYASDNTMYTTNYDVTVDVAKNNSSGIRGVYQSKKTGKWCAQITFQGKTRYLGSYDTLMEAARARERGEELFDDFLARYDAAELKTAGLDLNSLDIEKTAKSMKSAKQQKIVYKAI